LERQRFAKDGLALEVPLSFFNLVSAIASFISDVSRSESFCSTVEGSEASLLLPFDEEDSLGTRSD
jgi:hypothetical protein